MIYTLALFMPTEKLRLSCLAVEESSMLSPYFFLQGYVTVRVILNQKILVESL
jgi:hypothetical protein